jgi:group I intron endonuclease
MSQDLSKDKIYIITNDFNDEVYVGSTCDTLVKRFSAHKSSTNKSEKMQRPLYTLMREIGTERFRMELIEDYPCEDKYQLRQKEGEYIKLMELLKKNYNDITDFTFAHYVIEKKDLSKITVSLCVCG